MAPSRVTAHWHHLPLSLSLSCEVVGCYPIKYEPNILMQGCYLRLSGSVELRGRNWEHPAIRCPHPNRPPPPPSSEQPPPRLAFDPKPNVNNNFHKIQSS